MHDGEAASDPVPMASAGTTRQVAPSSYANPDALVALVGTEWADWYRLSPQERWREAERLWQTFTDLGGSLDVEPDSQSPFFHARTWRSLPAHGRPGVHHLRRRGV